MQKRISRDEVPVMYQQYVQEYFEQIRKTPPPPAQPKPAAAPKKSNKPSE